MNYPPVPDNGRLADSEFPETLGAWVALDADTLAAYRGVLTPDALVDVHDSFLAASVASLPFTVVQGRRCLPLHICEFWYGRLCLLGGDVAGRDPPVDLSFGIAPSALSRADDVAMAAIGYPNPPQAEGGVATMSAEEYLFKLKGTRARKI